MIQKEGKTWDEVVKKCNARHGVTPWVKKQLKAAWKNIKMKAIRKRLPTT